MLSSTLAEWTDYGYDNINAQMPAPVCISRHLLKNNNETFYSRMHDHQFTLHNIVYEELCGWP